MIDETGSVVELKGKHVAMVLCQKSSACRHCASMESCHVGNDNRSMLVEALNPIGAKVGDRVRIVTSSKSFLQSSFLLYIVPLIALIVGGIAGQLVGERMANGFDPNLLSAILGVSFLVGTFLTIRVGTRALPKERYMPQIMEVLPAEDVLAESLQNGR